MAGISDTLRITANLKLDELQKKECDEKGISWKGGFCCDGGYEKVDKEGRQCKGDLCVDHEDNNNRNNPLDGSNWRRRCRGHNGRKNHRGATKKPKLFEFTDLKESLKRVRIRDGEQGTEIEETQIRSAEFEKNKRCEPKVREFVSMLLKTASEISLNDLVCAAAEYTTQVFGAGNGIDQQTALRYIQKLCAPFVGRFEIYDRAKKGERKQLFVRKKVFDESDDLPITN